MQQRPPPPPGFFPVGSATSTSAPAPMQSMTRPPPPPGFQPVGAPRQPQQVSPSVVQPSSRPRRQPANQFDEPDPFGMNPMQDINDLGGSITGDTDPALFTQMGASPEFAPNTPGADQTNPINLSDPANIRPELLKKGQWVRAVTDRGEEIYQLPGDAFRQSPRLGDVEMSGGALMRRPSLESSAEAFATAVSEQFPGMDEAVAGVGGLLTGRGFDATRQSQMLNRELLNQTNPVARDVGGVVGAVAPAALLPGAAFIRGGQGLNAVARAGMVGAGYGGLYGFGNTDGSLQDRAVGAGVGSASGLVTAGALQGLAGRLARSGQQAAANPSPQRQLSNAGVNLTPGQMMGGAAQTIEDAIGGTLPVFGDAINAAKRRGLESFDNVATNIALEPIGARIPNTAGREGVRQADDAISRAYDAALTGVSVSRDQAFDQAIQAARAPQGLTPNIRQNLNAVVDNILDPLQQGPVTGQAWKEVDSQLAAAIRAADRATDSAPEQRILRDRLSQTRDALGNLLERTDPFAFRDVRAADRANATYRIVRNATADAASAGRDGNTSPAALNRAVRASAGSRQFARGEGLLQDLTDSAMQVLPNTVPNSGTGLRGFVGGGLLTGAAFSPEIAIPAAAGLFTGGAAYSRPAINALNAAYRRHRAGSGRRSLGGLFGRAAPGSAALEQGILQYLLNQTGDDQALARGR